MKRKVIKHSPTNYVITLPTKWVNTYHIEKGDELELEQEGSSLLLRPYAAEKKKTSIDLTITHENKRFVKRIVNNVYRLGFDRINITYPNEHIYKEIQDVAHNVILGFEITEKKEKSCVIESITEPAELKEDAILRRAFLIIKEVIEVTQEDIQKSKYTNYDRIKELHSKQNQYCNLCMRMLFKNKRFDKRSHYKWMLFWHILVIFNNFKNLYYYLHEKKPAISKQSSDLLAEVQQLFDRNYKGYFKKDIDEMNKVNNECSSILYKKPEIYFKKINEKEGVFIYYLFEALRLIYLFVTPGIGTLIEV